MSTPENDHPPVPGTEPKPLPETRSTYELLVDLWNSLNCLPCCKSDFLGTELYRECFIAIHGEDPYADS